MQASFWLMDAPRSMEEQSHRMPDGTGLGWFSLGEEPVRDRAPIAAYEDTDFARAARDVVSHTFVSHVRYASTGAVSVHNSHPFVMNDRLFAHNGVVKGLDTLDSWLTSVDRALLEGETDSELVFAAITAEIRRLGDTTAGLIEAVRRMAAELPIYSLNILLAESRRLWALRYPEPNELWVLAPEFPGPGDVRRLVPDQEPGRVEVSVADRAGARAVPSYVVASERMDDDPEWRLLDPGELLVIDGLTATSLFPFEEPEFPLRHADLSLHEVSSQKR